MQGKRGERGFTIIETVLTAVIIGIIASVAAKVLVVGLDVYALIANRDDAFQAARTAMDRMVAEVVLIENSDITSMVNLQFGFRDQFGVGSTFRRTTVLGNPGLYRTNDYMVGNVSQLDFDYLRLDGTNAVFPWEVRRINIDMTVAAEAGAGNVHLRTEIFPRNFMYNNFQ